MVLINWIIIDGRLSQKWYDPRDVNKLDAKDPPLVPILLNNSHGKKE